MSIALNVIEYRNHTNSIVNVESFPDICPLCHRKQVPTPGTSYFDNIKQEVFSSWHCNNADCGKLFLADYAVTRNRTYSLKKLAPITLVDVEFPSEIKSLSVNYCQIYNEAMKAESYGLDNICGPGYRKALEFLVKDYCISIAPEKQEEIGKMTLQKCINDYIKDDDIKDCAERAYWLGNDETHYIRKWEDKDVRDLKMLISLTEHWMSKKALTKKYKEEMGK